MGAAAPNFCLLRDNLHEPTLTCALHQNSTQPPFAMSTTFSLPPLVLPGQPLPLTTQTALAGPGTTTHNNIITSTLAGTPSLLPSTPLPTLTVLPPSSTTPLLPTLNTIVLAQITRINPRQANCIIIAPCASTFAGVIRQQDVRSTEKDKVKVLESFKPGDVVRARVISLGDTAGYYLSTAGNDMGVVVARGGESALPD